ncbi:hypothetical protein GGR52DRAFT_577423 [Hypoxylon sp. FL1284]|nr:hypothetical protein GGR52DRAFT_577423 [Hypoxylon sp. FL1284]
MAARGMMYTLKLDGERTLVVALGGIAAFVSRGARMTCKAWKTYEAFTYDGITVYDTEYVPGLGYAAIDVLMINGRLAPEQRTMEWVYGCMVSKAEEARDLGIYVRKYGTLIDPVRELRLIPAVADGLMAIDQDSTNSRKLKVVKSVELVVSEDGSLLSRNGTEVFLEMSKPPNCQEGDIVEVRFRYGSNTPTDDEPPLFASGILSSMFANESNDNNDRRTALVWCRSISAHVNSLAENMVTNKRIIIDVGTGDANYAQDLRCRYPLLVWTG